MLTTWAFLSTFAVIPALPSLTEGASSIADLTGEFEPGADVASELMIPPAPRERSKKERWLQEKSSRHDVHVADRDLQRGPVTRLASANPRAGSTLKPITTLYNMWTKEALPLVPGERPDVKFHPFLRDHYTN